MQDKKKGEEELSAADQAECTFRPNITPWPGMQGVAQMPVRCRQCHWLCLLRVLAHDDGTARQRFISFHTCTSPHSRSRCCCSFLFSNMHNQSHVCESRRMDAAGCPVVD